MGRGTLEEARNGLEDPREGAGRVGGPSGRYGTGGWTLRQGWEWSRSPPARLQLFRRPCGRAGSGWGALRQDRNCSEGPSAGP